jgi:hypothetical protein
LKVSAAPPFFLLFLICCFKLYCIK